MAGFRLFSLSIATNSHRRGAKEPPSGIRSRNRSTALALAGAGAAVTAGAAGAAPRSAACAAPRSGWVDLPNHHRRIGRMSQSNPIFF